MLTLSEPSWSLHISLDCKASRDSQSAYPNDPKLLFCLSAIKTYPLYKKMHMGKNQIRMKAVRVSFDILSLILGSRELSPIYHHHKWAALLRIKESGWCLKSIRLKVFWVLVSPCSLELCGNSQRPVFKGHPEECLLQSDSFPVELPITTLFDLVKVLILRLARAWSATPHLLSAFFLYAKSHI